MNRTTNETSRTLVDQITPPTAFIFTGIFFTLSILCIFGNVLAFIVVRRTKNGTFSTKQSGKWLLSSLALCGVFTGSFWCTVCGVQLLTDSLRSNLLLEAVRRFVGISIPGNLMSMVVCISYDRYILLRHSSNHNKYMSRTKTTLMIVASWCIPIFISFLRFLNRSAFIFIVLFYILLSLCIVTLAYIFMVKLVRDSERKFVIKDKNMRPTQTRRLSKTIKLAKTASVLLVSFVICHLPFALFLLVRIQGAEVLSHHTQQIMLVCIEISSQANACLIPAIYFMMSDSYLRQARNLLKCNKPSGVELTTGILFYIISSPRLTSSSQSQSSPCKKEKYGNKIN